MEEKAMLRQMADTIRFLAADMVQQANSGHPGMPMGMADVLTVFSSFYKHNPKNPKWLNRDRVVFSGGHGSSLVYSLLHLWGYDLSLEDLKQFRQLDSKTPGHPENTHTPGVEVTTGPLGQGVANAVGFAMAAKYAGNVLNSDTAKFIDHKVYAFCGDGDLEEGISYEACSIAGHYKLDNLVLVYDDNNITIEGTADLAFTEDVPARFKAQGWDVVVIDGHDYDAITAAFEQAQNATKPLLIDCKTVMAKGCATKEGSHKTHGAPLGEEEIEASKAKAGFDPKAKFQIPEAALARFRTAIEKGDLYEREWNKLLTEAPLKEQNDALAALQNPDASRIDWPVFDEAMATRQTNHKILNAIAKGLPGFIGGSADLAPSNLTELADMGHFPTGRNIRFGIREHSMAAITNGIAMYGLFTPFDATFFVFSDYLKPAVRTASLMKAKRFFVWTHDSIGVGEDGGTHQPVEQLSGFRAMPGFYTFRPADGNENVACWKAALELDGPAGFVLSRQKTTLLDLSKAVGAPEKGGYLVSPAENAQITLLASGSEVGTALEAQALLKEEGIAANVVSVPCFELFAEQPQSYVDGVILPDTKCVAVEAASGAEWFYFAQAVVGMKTFGASAPAGKLFEKFGITAADVAATAKSLL